MLGKLFFKLKLVSDNFNFQEPTEKPLKTLSSLHNEVWPARPTRVHTNIPCPRPFLLVRGWGLGTRLPQGRIIQRISLHACGLADCF